MNSRNFVLHFAVLVSVCVALTSEMFWYNSPIEFEYVCVRPEATANVQQIIGTDLMTRDLARCIGSGLGIESFVCQTTNVTNWSKFMRTRIKECCSGPFRRFVGRRCVRNLPDSEPPRTPKRSCKAAVRKTSLGISVSCGCNGKRPVDVDFFIARNVDDCCLTKCVEKKKAKFCSAGMSKSDIRRKVLREFSKCCGSGKCDQTKSVGTKTLNGGYTCGLNLKFGKPNPVIFDFPPLRTDC